MEINKLQLSDDDSNFDSDDDTVGDGDSGLDDEEVEQFGFDEEDDDLDEFDDEDDDDDDAETEDDDPFKTADEEVIGENLGWS